MLMHSLSVNEALNKMGEPELGYTLCFDLCEHISIPREVLLNDVLGFESMSFIGASLALQIRGKIVVVGEIKAFLEVLFDLINDILDLTKVVFRLL